MNDHYSTGTQQNTSGPISGFPLDSKYWYLTGKNCVTGILRSCGMQCLVNKSLEGHTNKIKVDILK